MPEASQAVTGLSCLGEVRHLRTEPRRHAFRYRVWMLCVDLAVLSRMPLRHRLFRFPRGELLTNEAVGEELARAGIAVGRLRTFLLTQPASFGYGFNPVNFYFCLREGGLVAVLLQVTNTPWGERHCYVLDAGGRPACGRHRFRFPKVFHVSPFLSMRGSYRMNLTLGHGRIRVAMLLRDGSAPFFASLSVRTRPLTLGALIAGHCRRPAQNALTLARIYWQALRLYAKRTPVFAHPRNAAGKAR